MLILDMSCLKKMLILCVANEEEFRLRYLFNKYMASLFGEDAKYVDLNDFVNTFRKKVTIFYKKLIEDMKKNSLIEEDRVRIITTKICSEVQKGVMNAALIEEIYLNCDGSRIILLNGFTEEETEKIFISLKELILNEYVFDAEGYSIKKV